MVIKYHFFFARRISFIYQTILKFHTSFLSLIFDNNVSFFIYLYNQSNGFPETKVLKTSCSIINLSINVDFSAFLKDILFSRSQKSHWLALEEFAIQSIIDSIFSRKTLRSSNRSNAPDFINHSRLFLFNILAHLLQKSSIDTNLPFFNLSSWIVSHVSNQTHLIDINQILTVLSIAATWLNDSFTSGFSTSIHFCWISEI